MIREIVVFVSMLILYPLVYYYGRYAKISPFERPLILNSVIVQIFFFAIMLSNHPRILMSNDGG